MSEGRKKKGFAVAGFVLSLIGMIGPLILILYLISSPIADFVVEGIEGIYNWPSPSQEIALSSLAVVGFAGSSAAILGVVFSSVGIAKAKKGFGGKKQAIAGLILGIIGLISPILVFAMIIYTGLVWMF